MLDAFVTFGRSGLRVSRYGLGGFNFGGREGWSLSAETARALMARYRALGGNFLDLANIYGGGEAEMIVGEYLATSAGSRETLVIASKFSGSMRHGDPNAGGGGRKAVIQACEDSLRRLRTDRIDLYWMHVSDPHTPMEETLRALDDLVRSGKVLHIGLCNRPAWKMAEAHFLAELQNLTPIIGMQLQYSLLERSIELELVPFARAYGMGIAAWSPLKSGALAGHYRRDKPEDWNAGGRGKILARAFDARADAVLPVLHDVAGRLEASPAQVALAWLQAQPWVSTILIGAHDLRQMEENLAASRLVLPADDLAALSAASPPPLTYPIDFEGRAHGAVSGGTRINFTGGAAQT
jgi:aryl-alcohol dehydrogenase-like predicted oxidoreductase